MGFEIAGFLQRKMYVYISDVTSLGSDSRTRRLDPIFGDSKRLRLDFLMVRLIKAR